MRFGVGEGINQLFSNFLGKTLACFKRKSYLCFIKRNINNLGIMKQVEERYISLLTDFGFKRIFGSAPNKWLYALKNLYKLTQRPKALCDKVFDRLFEEAEIARFTPQEQREYEASKMAYRDIKNSIDTAKREGKEEGLAEGMEKGLAEGMEKGLAEGMEKGMNQRSLEIARKMQANGMDAATVMEITGLSESQLQQLKE